MPDTTEPRVWRVTNPTTDALLIDPFQVRIDPGETIELESDTFHSVVLTYEQVSGPPADPPPAPVAPPVDPPAVVAPVDPPVTDPPAPPAAPPASVDPPVDETQNPPADPQES